MARRDVLISGGGIAGLTLAILLKQQGFEPLVIEREPALPAEGYMMDFFGTGWDVAERMELIEELRAIRYPIDTLQFVDAEGSGLITVPIERIRRALDNRYVYLRRADLARILHERARSAGVDIHFGQSIQSLEEFGDEVRVLFEGGGRSVFSLVFGADGIHSRVRELVFGPEDRFDRFLGYYVAAFHIAGHDYGLGRTTKLYEEPNRLSWLYPLGEQRLDATCVFRHADVGRVPVERRMSFIRENYAGAGWLAERVFEDHPASQPLYFDTATQIVIPDWHKGRVALLGDACGALTLLAGQGSQMAMAGAYVLAQELARHGGDHRAAFTAYQAFLKPHVEQKQRDAAWLSRMFVPTEQSWPWLRRLVIRLILSAPLARFTMAYSGATSALKDYPSS
jgi:2-polyprenyl-6-methoxyphenol hydroxylase-like FAD-dependent oxidoreductase